MPPDGVDGAHAPRALCGESQKSTGYVVRGGVRRGNLVRCFGVLQSLVFYLRCHCYHDVFFTQTLLCHCHGVHVANL